MGGATAPAVVRHAGAIADRGVGSDVAATATGHGGAAVAGLELASADMSAAVVGGAVGVAVGCGRQGGLLGVRVLPPTVTHILPVAAATVTFPAATVAATSGSGVFVLRMTPGCWAAGETAGVLLERQLLCRQRRRSVVSNLLRVTRQPRLTIARVGCRPPPTTRPPVAGAAPLANRRNPLP